MRISLSILAYFFIPVFIYAQTINVTPNWQLLGALDNINSSIFDGKCVDFVWKYDNGWQVHVANGKSYTLPSNVTTFNSINSAEGFWIKGNSNCTIDTSTYPYVVLKTGQIYSFIDGDDGYYQKGVPKSLKLINNTVEDKVTGLMWQNTTAQNGQIYDDAISYCEDLVLDGYDDWRLPSRYELSTIYDYNSTYKFNPTFYPIGGSFWTNTTNPKNDTEVWTYQAFDADGEWQSKSYHYETLHTMCVRGAKLIEHQLTRDDTLGVVIDKTSKLMWEDRELNTTSYTISGDDTVYTAANESEYKTWDEAINYCEDLNYAGYSDWRVPNINELISIIDLNTSKIYDTFKNTLFDGHYWTSTTEISDIAYRVDMSDGSIGIVDKNATRYVRCVRDSE